MTDYIPENGDANRPPSELQTTYECGHCGNEFDSPKELGQHAVECAAADDEGE